MVRWNAPFEVEEVEQLALIVPLPTHHDPLRRSTNRATENHAAPIITSPFSTASVKSGHHNRSAECPLYLRKRTFIAAVGMSVLGQKLFPSCSEHRELGHRPPVSGSVS